MTVFAAPEVQAVSMAWVFAAPVPNCVEVAAVNATVAALHQGTDGSAGGPDQFRGASSKVLPVVFPGVLGMLNMYPPLGPTSPTWHRPPVEQGFFFSGPPAFAGELTVRVQMSRTRPIAIFDFTPKTLTRKIPDDHDCLSAESYLALCGDALPARALARQWYDVPIEFHPVKVSLRASHQSLLQKWFAV